MQILYTTLAKSEPKIGLRLLLLDPNRQIENTGDSWMQSRMLLASAMLVLCASVSVSQPPQVVPKSKVDLVKSLTGNDAATEKQLVEYLREDPDAEVRREAARTLGKRPTSKLALAALYAVASDAEEISGVRTAALYSLGRLGRGSEKVKKLCLRFAEEPQMAMTALKALIDSGFTADAKPFLTHKDPTIRQHATSVLLNSGEGDGFLTALTHTDPKIVSEAMKRASQRGIPPTHWKKEEIEAVQKLTTGTDPHHTALGVTALVQLNKTGPIAPFLAECLSSSDELVLNAGVRGLEVAGPAVTPLLPKILDAIDKVPNRKKAQLIRALGEAGAEAKPALPKIYSFLSSKDVELRQAAMTSLLKAGAADPKGATAKVKLLARDPDNTVRDLVEKFLSQVPSDPSELGKQLANRDWRVGLRTLPAIARLGADAVSLAPDILNLAARIPLAGKGVPIEAGGAPHELAATLAELGPKAVPVVARGLSAKDERVRLVAAWALQKFRIDGVGAMDELRKAVSDTSRGVRQFSLSALSNLGYRAQPAVPELLKVGDSFPDSAKDAAYVLTRIAVSGGDPKRQAERDLTLKRHLAELKGLDQSRSPHEAIFEILLFELTPEQKRLTAEAVSGILSQKEPHIQAELLKCLGWLGTDASVATPEVEKLLTSPDARVKGIAQRTVPLIKP